MVSELKNLTIETFLDTGRGDCLEIKFKEIGLVVFERKYFDQKVLRATLKSKSPVLAKIEKAPVPYITELYMLTQLYGK